MLNFQCKYCENDIQADYPLIGEFVECPVCGEVVVVPDPLLAYGSEYNGYIIERLRASTLLWNTYQVSPVNAELSGLNQYLLRIPGSFFLKRLSDFDKFCEVVVNSGSLGIKGISPLVKHSIVPGKTFFVFEFFPSTDLNVFIAKTGPLDVTNSLRIIRRCAVALRQAWNDKNIIHQNILPHNIRINAQRDIRLMNLGLSQFLLKDNHLLEEGFNIWDQRYISPEFALRGQADSPSCDIYALGMVLFFLLTGNHPYSLVPEENIPHSPIPDLKSETPNVSDDVIALFQLMVAKRLSLRFSDWSEVLERIDAILQKSRKRHDVKDFDQYYSNVKTRTDRRKPVALTPMIAMSTEKIKKSRPKKSNQDMSETIARPVNHNKKTRLIQSVMRNSRRKRGFIANNVGLLAAIVFFTFCSIGLLVFWMSGESRKNRRATKTDVVSEQVAIAKNHSEDDSDARPNRAVSKQRSATPSILLRRHLKSAMKYLKDHPDDLDGSLKRLEAVIPEAVNLDRFDIVNIIREKTDVISTRKASLEEDRVRNVMKRIRKKVEPFLRSGNFDRAEAYVNEYDGPFKMESRFARKRLAVEIENSRIEKKAASDKVNGAINKLAVLVASPLLSGDVSKARKILKEYNFDNGKRKLSPLILNWLAGLKSYDEWVLQHGGSASIKTEPHDMSLVAPRGNALARGLSFVALGDFDSAESAFKNLNQYAVDPFLKALSKKRMAVRRQSIEKKLVEDFSLLVKPYSLEFDESSPETFLLQLAKVRISRQNAKKLASKMALFVKEAMGSEFMKEHANLVEAVILLCDRKSGDDSDISLDIAPQKILSPKDDLNKILNVVKPGTSIKLGKGQFRIARITISASSVKLAGVPGTVLTGGPLIIKGAKCSLTDLAFTNMDVTFSHSPASSMSNCGVTDGNLELIESEDFVLDNTFISSMLVRNSSKLKVSHCTFASLDASLASLRIDTKELLVVDSIVYGRGVAILLLRDGTNRKCKFEHSLIFGEKALAARDRGNGFFKKRDLAPTKSRIRRFIKSKDNLFSPPQFVNYLKGDWRLVPKVPGTKSSSDGKDRGVVWPAVDR